MVEITNPVSTDLLNQAQFTIDMESQAAELFQDTYKFETLTRKLNGGMITAKNRTHRWREDRLIPSYLTVTNDVASGATVLPVSTPNVLVKGMTLAWPGYGLYMVNENYGGGTTAGSVTIIDLGNGAQGGATLLAIPQGTVLSVLPEAHAEGTAIPNGVSNTQDDFFTPVQQFDHVYSHTDWLKWQEKYDQNTYLATERTKHWINLKKRLNSALYASQPTYTTDSAGKLRYTLAGLIWYLRNQEIDCSFVGGVTINTLAAWIRPTMQYINNRPPMVISGANGWASISSFGSTLVRITPGDNQLFGVQFDRLVIPFAGTVDIMYDQALSPEAGGANLAGRMFILQTNYVKQGEMQGMPLVIKTSVQNQTDIHNEIDVITGTRMLELQLPELHVSVKNIQ